MKLRVVMGEMYNRRNKEMACLRKRERVYEGVYVKCDLVGKGTVGGMKEWDV